MVEALSAAGGWDITVEEINTIGLRAINMGRLFLVREGFTAQDDALSARAYHKLSDGPIAGKSLSPDELSHWLQVYYRRMGWDENGIPTREALAALDII
jgi:aldehyde:ferredoxin oxidoreductase